MNKYEKLATPSRRKRRQARMCTRKRAYASAEEAYQKGQTVYQCPYCKQYHRSGKQTEFLRELQRIAARAQTGGE